MQLSRNQKHFVAWLLIAVLLSALVYALGSVLTPFAVAALLAYVLSPLVDRLQRWTRHRFTRTFLSFCLLAVLGFSALGLLLIMVPILADDIPRFQQKLPALLEQGHGWVTQTLGQLGVRTGLDFSKIQSELLEQISSNTQNISNYVLKYVGHGGAFAVNLLANLVLIPLVLFYFLVDGRAFVRQIHEMIPRPVLASVESFVQETDTVMGRYLRGQLSVMAVMATYYSIGLALFGLDLALPIGIFSGMAVIVPYVGFAAGMLLCVLAGLIQLGLTDTAIMIVVVYFSGQMLEGYYFTPKWVGESIGLHPVVVIFALMAFGKLFGFVGVLIALPASAVLYVAYRRLQSMYRASPLYRG